jgi:hypothetical protein
MKRPRKKTRSLYQCSHARVRGERILCCKGHTLLKAMEGNGVDIKRLARGEPLIFRACQDCPDFDSMGPPVPKSERGWVNQ